MRLEEHFLLLFIPRREPKRNVCFSPYNKSAVNSLKHMDELLPWYLVKNPPADAADMGLIFDPGRSRTLLWSNQARVTMTEPMC